MNTTAKFSTMTIQMKKTRGQKPHGHINRVAGAILITVGLSVLFNLWQPGSIPYPTNIFAVDIVGGFSLIVEGLNKNVRLVVCLRAIT